MIFREFSLKPEDLIPPGKVSPTRGSFFPPWPGKCIAKVGEYSIHHWIYGLHAVDAQGRPPLDWIPLYVTTEEDRVRMRCGDILKLGDVYIHAGIGENFCVSCWITEETND